MCRYNVTEDILPFTTYGFQVSFCNAIGCGEYTDPESVMTEQDGMRLKLHDISHNHKHCLFPQLLVQLLLLQMLHLSHLLH